MSAPPSESESESLELPRAVVNGRFVAGCGRRMVIGIVGYAELYAWPWRKKPGVCATQRSEG